MYGGHAAIIKQVKEMRVKPAGDGILKVAEGWHAGPGIDPVEDPSELGPQVMELMWKARPNADIWGRDIVS